MTTTRKIRLAALLSVMGPGIIAGLSDDDPAGITTYSQLGAKFGYQMLWVLVLSTIASSHLPRSWCSHWCCYPPRSYWFSAPKVWSAFWNLKCQCVNHR